MPNYKFSIQVDASLSPAALGNIQSQLNSLGKKSKINLDSSSINKTSGALRDASKHAGVFGQSMLDASKKILTWSIATNAVYGLIHAVQDGIGVVISMDKALVNLQMATGGTYAETQALIKSYNQMAHAIGSTTKEVADSANSWLRQGLTVKETNQMIQASMALSKLGMIDSASATDYLTSATKGYKVAAQDAMGVVDKLSSVDMKAAVSAGGIAEALSRTSNIAQMTGVSLDKLISYVTTVGEVTQKDMSSIGESFKTIFTRMQNVKLGKWLDDEGNDLSNVETILKSLGIELRDSADTFRNFGNVLDDVGGNWQNYSNVQKAAIASAFAGTRQAENFLSLMENYGKSLEYTSIAADSAGTAMEKMQDYEEGIEARTNKLTAAFEKLAMQTVSGDFVKGVLDLGTGLLQLVSSLDLVNVGVSVLFAWLIRIVGVKVIGWVSGLISSMTQLNSTLGNSKLLWLNLWNNMKAGLASAGITAGIGLAIYAITKFIEKQKELKDTYNDLVKESQKSAKSYADNKDEINSLVNQLGNVKDGSKEYFEITSKLNSLAPDFIDHVNSEGNAYAKSKDLLDQYITSLNNLADAYDNLSTYSISDYLVQQEELDKSFEGLMSGLRDWQKSLNETVDNFFKIDRPTSSKNMVEDLMGMGSAEEMASYLRNMTDMTESEMADFILALQSYLIQLDNFKADVIEGVSNNVAAITKIPEEFMPAVQESIAMAISTIDLNAEGGLEKVRDTAITKAKEIAEAFSGIDQNALGSRMDGIFEKFAGQDFQNAPSYVTGFQSAVRALGKEFGLTGDALNVFVDAMTQAKEAEDAATESAKEFKDATSFKGEIDTVNEALSSQAESGYLTAEMYQKLIELSPDYAQALMYENGQMKLNEDAVKKYTAAKKETVLADLEAQRIMAQNQYAENARRIEDITRSYRNLTPERQAELDALRSENSSLADSIANFGLLAGEVESATSSLNQFKSAMSMPDYDDAYNTAIEAIKVIDEGLKSGETNSRKYKAAIDYLFGETPPDNVSEAIKEMKKYVQEGEDGVDGLIQKLKDLGYVTDNGDGTVTIDIPNLDDLMNQLGASPELVDALMGKLEMFGDVKFTDTKQGIDEIATGNQTAADNAQTLIDNLTTLQGTTIRDLGFSALSSYVQTVIDKVDKLAEKIRNMPKVSSGGGGGKSAGDSIYGGQSGANGLQNAKAGATLVGEEGREAKVSNGIVSIVGQNGPEVINLRAGDTIIPNDETEAYLSNGSQALAGGASVTLPKPKSSGKGKGSGKGKSSSSSSSGDDPTYAEGLKSYFDIQIDALDSQIKKREKNIELIDKQIDKEQALLDTMRQQNEKEDKQRTLKEAINKLDNIRNEKNVRMLNAATGKFEWVADPRALREQQQVVDDLKRDYDRYLAEQAIEKRIDKLEKQKDAEQAVIDTMKKQQEAMSEFASDMGLLDDEVLKNVNSWGELTKAMKDAGIAYTDISGMWGGSGSSSGGSNPKASAISDKLKKGSRGNDVKTLQRALNALGYNSGSVDGIFGSKTQSALKSFQKAMGIDVTGVLDAATKSKFKAKGYRDGGVVDYTGGAMVHGSQLKPEYMYSAQNVESMMSSVPALLAKMSGGGLGDIIIQHMEVIANNANEFMRSLQNNSVLAHRVARR